MYGFPSPDEIFMIDHEYGCPNFSAYDIANHFNEWAGNYKTHFI